MKKERFLIIAFLTFAELASGGDVPCMAKKVEAGYVCVCNETYCDTIESPTPLQQGLYYHYSTSDLNPGFTRTVSSFTEFTNPEKTEEGTSNDVYITVDDSIQYQTFEGIGASLTSCSGMLINGLSPRTKQKFFESYFGNLGLEFTFIRAPVAASDFSERFYTYDDVPGDFELKNFNLTEEDFKIKIPLIKLANSVSSRGLKVIGSTWTAPYWMKTNNDSKAGFLHAKYLSTWAKYYLKSLEAYDANGVDFWGLTQGNEVILPLMIGSNFPIQNMVFLPYQARYWTKKYLGPLLKKSKFKTVKLIILDDERPFMLWYTNRFFADNNAAKYVDGVGLHWYFDNSASLPFLETFHNVYPDKFLLYTESSIQGFRTGGHAVSLGDWRRAAKYITSILQSFSHWVVGFIDWNIVLNENGGPTGPANMTLDASSIVNETSGEFYKQPMFYALGHFSKFILPGSKRIKIIIRDDSLEHTAQTFDQMSLNFDLNGLVPTPPTGRPPPSDPTGQPPSPTSFPFPTAKPEPVMKSVLALATSNPDGSHTLIAYNPKSEPVNLIVTDPDVGTLNKTVAANSLNTIIYW